VSTRLSVPSASKTWRSAWPWRVSSASAASTRVASVPGLRTIRDDALCTNTTISGTDAMASRGVLLPSVSSTSIIFILFLLNLYSSPAMITVFTLFSTASFSAVSLSLASSHHTPLFLLFCFFVKALSLATHCPSWSTCP
jgi:hypothetical protein